MAGIRNELTEMLGIELPIIGAPMFLVSYEELVAAVSNAGGLGCLALPNYRTLDDLDQALETLRRATDRPFGVNIHVSGRFPWNEQLDLCLDRGVRCFITSLGAPAPVIDGVHARGGLVFVEVVNLDQAVRAEQSGADGLIAVAQGAGGHGGVLPLMVLVPHLKEHTCLPVVAAGGISNGSQMAAALALGAWGVVTGTRLVASEEARVSDTYKQAVVASGPGDIVVTDRITGNRASWIAKSIEGVESGPGIGSKRWLDLWSAGVSVAQADAVKPASTIINDMVDGFYGVVNKFSTLEKPAHQSLA